MQKEKLQFAINVDFDEEREPTVIVASLSENISLAWVVIALMEGAGTVAADLVRSGFPAEQVRTDLHKYLDESIDTYLNSKTNGEEA